MHHSMSSADFNHFLQTQLSGQAQKLFSTIEAMGDQASARNSPLLKNNMLTLLPDLIEHFHSIGEPEKGNWLQKILDALRPEF